MKTNRRLLSCLLCLGLMAPPMPVFAGPDEIPVVGEGEATAPLNALPEGGWRSDEGLPVVNPLLGLSGPAVLSFLPLVLSPEFAGAHAVLRHGTALPLSNAHRVRASPSRRGPLAEAPRRAPREQLAQAGAEAVRAQASLEREGEQGLLEARQAAAAPFEEDAAASPAEAVGADVRAGADIAVVGASRNPGKATLAQRLREEPALIFELHPGQSFSPVQRHFIERVLMRHLGLLSVLSGPNTLRPMVVDREDLILEGFKDEKALEARWSKDATEPHIRIERGTRALILPRDYEADDQTWAYLLRRWLIGSSLHPLGSKAEVVKARHAVGDPTFTPREVQEEGIAAGQAALERGDPSFLYVAPTGTGKSHVIVELLRHRLKHGVAALHIVTADKTLLTDQLARKDLAALDREGLARVEQWGGGKKAPKIEELLERVRRAEAEGVPLILVSTTQSLLARFYAATRGVRRAAQALEPLVEELRTKYLGTVLFDEAHHAGAETAARLIADLTAGTSAVKLGVTATPVSPNVSIQELFDHRAFWAYLDGAESYLEKPLEVERSVGEIMDQLAAAIDNGDLTPQGAFYPINPESVVPSDGKGAGLFERIESENGGVQYIIRPEHYEKLIRRLGPLFQRHRHGFVAASNIAEAKALAEALNQAVPSRRFAEFHSTMPSEERERVIKGLRNGEINFAVTVNMLDEGLDFPDFSLYVDVDRGIGPRQFIQRWGRLTRIYPGKEAVEVAVLMDPLDEAMVRENLEFLDRLNEGKFNGSRGGAKGGGALVIDVPELGELSAVATAEELQRLLDQMRAFWNNRREDPVERLNAKYKELGHLPTPSESRNDYRWWNRLVRGQIQAGEDEPQWPAGLDQGVVAALNAEYARRRSGVSPEAERLNAKYKELGHLPTPSESRNDYVWWNLLMRERLETGADKPEWPAGLDQGVVAALNAGYAWRRSGVSPEAERLNAKFEELGHLPTESESRTDYGWWNLLVRRQLKAGVDKPQWPAGLDQGVVAALNAEYARRRSGVSPEAERLNAKYKELGRLPTGSESQNDYLWWKRLVKGQIQAGADEPEWPAGLDSEVVAALNAEYARRRSGVSPAAERLNAKYKELGHLPTPSESKNDYGWWNLLMRERLETGMDKPRWPAGLDQGVVAALNAEYARRRSGVSPAVERLNAKFEELGHLPTGSESRNDYGWWNLLMRERLETGADKPEWPAGLDSEVVAALNAGYAWRRSAESPAERLNAKYKELGRLPTGSESQNDYLWWNRLVRGQIQAGAEEPQWPAGLDQGVVAALNAEYARRGGRKGP